MPTDSLRGSVQSVFLDFSYSSGSEADFKHKKNTQRQNFSSSYGGRSYATSSTPSTGRLSAGEDSTMASLRKCRKKFTVCKKPKPNTNVTHVHLQLNKTPEEINQNFVYCKPNVKKEPRNMTRGTQTLYRESSAQTLPYLPEVKNDPKVLEYIEIFKLPKIIPGDGPPGLYEVEMLERARKRWAFANALKNQFKDNIELARKQICQAKYKKILESFAFEQWLEREEYIMECQMMRLEIVIRMFNEREQEMHRKSKTAIETAHARIIAQRDAALLRNDIEFKRAARRLETTRAKKIRFWRIWRKQLLSRRLGDPRSLFNSPQMRFGVNPNRRHLKLFGKKIFETEAMGIEKEEIDLNKIECPFAKVSKWAEPKKITEEIEMGFLTDENLQKLYDSLKSLRLQLVKRKIEPKCLVKKEQVPQESLQQSEEMVQDEMMVEDEGYHEKPTSRSIRFMLKTGQPNPRAQRKFSNFLYEMRQEYKYRRLRFFDKRREEIEGLLAAYEGKRIGWILRFLGEEKMRLHELRKLHAITMMAQRERWRREAAEAGLRQKENDMRQLFEELYRYVDQVNTNVGETYLLEILKPDTYAYADDVATSHIETLAKQIDADLSRWIIGFMDVQQPTTYDFLRYLLKDLVFPNVNDVVHNKEKKKIVTYIIYEVLLPKVFDELEAFDISFDISSQLISRLIDDDLLLFSSEDCSSVCDCVDVCECPEEEKETKAILRKLVRYAVTGRRWKTEVERVAYENFMDIVDEAFDTIDHDGLDNTACQTRLMLKDSEARTSTENISDVMKSDKSSVDVLKAADSYWQLPEYKPSGQRVGFSISTNIYSEILLRTEKHSVFVSNEMVVQAVISEILREIFDYLLLPGDEELEENTLREYSADESQHESDRKERICEENEIHPEQELQSIEAESESYLEITQSELYRMLENRCKCTEEILREHYVKQMMLRGKVRIIGKREDAEKSVSEVTAFDYTSEGAEELPMDDIQSKLSYDVKYDYVVEHLDKSSDSDLDQAIEDRSEPEHVEKIEKFELSEEPQKTEVVEEQADSATPVDNIAADNAEIAGKEAAMESADITETTTEQADIEKEQNIEATEADTPVEAAVTNETEVPAQAEETVEAVETVEPEVPVSAADNIEITVVQNEITETPEELPPEEPDKSNLVQEDNKRRTLIDD